MPDRVDQAGKVYVSSKVCSYRDVHGKGTHSE